MPLEFLFGRKKTPQEMLRQNQRALNKAMRDLDRERQHMEQQEKKTIGEIKKMAKAGQMVKSSNSLTLSNHSKYYTDHYIRRLFTIKMKKDLPREYAREDNFLFNHG